MKLKTGQANIGKLGDPMDHVTEVQDGINNMNRTLSHMEKLAVKYRNAPSDLSVLRNAQEYLNAVKANIQRQFENAGVADAIKW
jgi:hypothetical protein